ncbi:hypothetical protein SCORR_v1c08060 [Spiroplasma corruscae]|uniref:Uncharacterized protein n=1 Tax=Spiroplasma corruscae TaxID=216934 RepID=A0A222EPW8_9MOLU|nr:hypothetical protein [Spiroplasma corruscae]ASP28578.1 hypothetical protein SCORR_v1c08060 [Spiroplasma corruscae]
MKNGNKKNNLFDNLSDEDLDLKIKKLKSMRLEYFKLSTKKITHLSLLLAINVILSFICFLIFTKIAFLGFLKIELSFITYILCWRLINSFYASLIVFIGTWLRFGWLDIDFVGLISLNISDLLALWLYICFHHIFTRIIKFDKKVYKYLLPSLSIIITIISVGLINVVLNFLFLLPMYIYFLGYYESASKFLESLNLNWPLYGSIIFGFNLLKYSINFIIYVSIQEVLEKIVPKL